MQLVAFFIALARCMGILSDPIVAQLSDMFRGIYGRRRPFFFAGSWLYGMLILMVLSPPEGLDPTFLVVWFGCIVTLFYVTDSFTILPYEALGPELASSYDDRTTLYYFGSVFELCGGAFLMGLAQLGFESRGGSGDNEGEDACHYSRCYDDSGATRTGRIDPRTSDYHYYSIFDVSGGSYGADLCTQADGSAYSSNEALFTNGGLSGPEVCTQPYYASSSQRQHFIGEQDIAASHLADMASDVAASGGKYNWAERRAACLTTYCSCVTKSSTLCTNTALHTQSQYSGVAASLWVVVTLCLVAMYFKERVNIQDARRKLQPPTSIVSSITGILRNAPFMSVLPAFVFDHLSYTVVTTLILYYVKAVVQPEFQSLSEGDLLNCNQGRKLHGMSNANADIGYADNSDEWRCSSTTVMGAVLLSMGLSALATGPLWYLSSIKYGKRTTWLLSSVLTLVSVFLFLAIGKGDVDAAIFLAAVPGAVLGNFYLSDAILADIIEYEEYLSGQRAEATFIMAKSAIGKLLAIPAAALPLALLESYGYQSIEGGSFPVRQPHSAGDFVKTFLVTTTSIFSVLSLYCKIQYPFMYKDQLDLVADGVGLHMLGKSSYDPMTTERYSRKDNTFSIESIYGQAHDPSYHQQGQEGLDSPGSPLSRRAPASVSFSAAAGGAAGGGSGGSEKTGDDLASTFFNATVLGLAHAAESRKADNMDHFPRIKDVRDLLKASRSGKEFLVIAHLIAKSRDRLCYSAFIAVGALATLGATFRYNSDASGRSFVPVLMLSVFVFALLLCLYYGAKLRAAFRLKGSKYRPSVPLLEMMGRYREKIDSIHRSATIDIVGIDRARKKMKRALRRALHGEDSDSEDSEDDLLNMNSLRKLKHDKAKAAREQLRRDLKSRRMSRVSQGAGAGAGGTKGGNVYDEKDDSSIESRDSGSDDLALNSDDDDHGHKGKYAGKKEAVIHNWLKLIGMDDVIRQREQEQKRLEAQEERSTRAGVLSARQQRMYNPRKRSQALQEGNSDYLSRELVFNLERICRVPLREEQEARKRRAGPRWKHTLINEKKQKKREEEGREKKDGRGKDKDEDEEGGEKENKKESEDGADEKKEDGDSDANDGEDGDSGAGALPHAQREHTQWEDEFYRFVLAQQRVNRSEGVDLRQDSVRDDGLAALWREADGEEDFARQAFGAVRSIGNRGGKLSVEKIKSWQDRRASVAGEAEGGSGDSGQEKAKDKEENEVGEYSDTDSGSGSGSNSSSDDEAESSSSEESD